MLHQRLDGVRTAVGRLNPSTGLDAGRWFDQLTVASLGVAVLTLGMQS